MHTPVSILHEKKKKKDCIHLQQQWQLKLQRCRHKNWRNDFHHYAAGPEHYSHKIRQLLRNESTMGHVTTFWFLAQNADGPTLVVFGMNLLVEDDEKVDDYDYLLLLELLLDLQIPKKYHCYCCYLSDYERHYSSWRYMTCSCCYYCDGDDDGINLNWSLQDDSYFHIESVHWDHRICSVRLGRPQPNDIPDTSASHLALVSIHGMLEKGPVIVFT